MDPTPSPTQSALAPPRNGQQVTVGPFDVAPGKEVQLCRTMKLDNDKPVGINRINVQMNHGSHHFILFRSNKDFPDQTFPCWGTVNFDDWDFVVDVNRSGGADWQLPADQAFVFQPHQQIMMQVHYVNATTVQSPVGGLAYLNLYQTPVESVVHELHGMFTVDTRVHIEPHSWYTTKRLCTFNREVMITSMTGHFHARGKLFTVDKLYSPDQNNYYDDLGVPLYWNDSWDAPLFKTFNPPVDVHGDDGVRFGCEYLNNTDMTIGFGSHADVQEHCNLFFQYYYPDPAPGTSPDKLHCIQGSGGW